MRETKGARNTRAQGSKITQFTGSTAPYNVSTKQEIILFKQMCDTINNKGATETKEGRDEKKQKVGKKRRDGAAGS